MNRKTFFSIIFAAFFSSFCAHVFSVSSAQKNIATLTSWEKAYVSNFEPSWDLLPSVQKTHDLFSATISIPDDAQKNEQDSSIVFTTDAGRVTLFSNGVMRTERSTGGIDFFDLRSSALCSVLPSGEINASHADPSLMNSCGVAIDNGELVFRSFKIINENTKKLNAIISLQDGSSNTFQYLEDQTVVVHESSGSIEIIDSEDLVASNILQAHGMISAPQDALCALEGLLCKDGEGITCYVLEGIKFHVDVNGLKFYASVPTFGVQLEGLVANDRLLTRWKLGEGLQPLYKNCCFEGFDILFDAVSGRSLLYVNLLTFRVGLFFYDDQGNYCRKTGTGSVRYGKIASMLTYDGVSDAVVKKKSMLPEGHVLGRDFKPKILDI